MNHPATLLLGVALCVSPCSADIPKAVFKGPVSTLARVAPAAKPVLMHTGKALAPLDKVQVINSAIKNFTVKFPAQTAKVLLANQLPGPITIKLNSLYQAGVIDAVAVNPLLYDQSGYLGFGPFGPTQSMLQITFTVAARAAYMLTFNANATMGNQTFTVITWLDQATTSDTLTAGTPGASEYAFACVANSVGQMTVMISSNDAWNFESAQLTAVPF